MKFGKINIILQSILFLIILFVFSCDDYCEMTDYESYLPLKIGNQWNYENNETHEVVGKSIIEGEEYFDIQIAIENYEGDVIINHEFYYFNKSKLFQYYDNKEVLIADFALKEGDDFQQDNTGFNVLIDSDDPSEFTFIYNHPEWADEEYNLTFKHGVGIVSECSLGWGWCTELIDYDLQ